MSKLNRPTTFYATISITIVLILVGLFLTLFLHTGNITNILKQNINLLAEVQDVLPESELQRLIKLIKNTEGVLPQSIEFIQKEKALDYMAGEFGKLTDVIDNPFKNIIKFNIKAEYYNENKILKIKEMLEMEKGIIGFYYENEGIEMVQKNIKNFSFVLLGLATIFVLLSIAIIYNTLRLTLLADEKKIKTMQLVGAKRSFIKKPYYIWGIKMSIIATFFVILVLSGVYLYAVLYNPLLLELLNITYLFIIVAICFLLSLLITLSASRVILHHFLKNSLT
jgi:cell division transport system permease protein